MDKVMTDCQDPNAMKEILLLLGLPRKFPHRHSKPFVSLVVLKHCLDQVEMKG